MTIDWTYSAVAAKYDTPAAKSNCGHAITKGETMGIRRGRDNRYLYICGECYEKQRGPAEPDAPGRHD